MGATTPNPAAQIEQVLRQRFEPVHLAVRDDSRAHAGHHSAGGKGHFHVIVVSTTFEGLRPLQRHRLVNDALSPLFDTIIHALAIETLTPLEFEK